jgi:hypothetical protein
MAPFRVHATVTIVFCAALGVQSAPVGRVVASFQGLEGTALRPVESGETLLDGLVELLGGRQPRGVQARFERVVVTEDSARRLTVTITYSGLSTLQLAGELRGRDRRPQSHVQVKPVALAADAGNAELTFELRPSVTEGPSIESSYLRLIAMGPGRGSTPVMSRTYELRKTWNATAAPSNVVITVVPKGIGTAATLGARPDYGAPSKVPGRGAGPSPASARPTADRDQARGRGTTGRRSATVIVRDRRTGEVETRETSRDHRTRQRDVAERTRPASATLAPNSRLVQADRFGYGIKPEDAKKGAQGPPPAPIELLEGLRTEDIDLDPASLLSIATSIYPDKNPASGIFYYHPRSYHLEWTPESGHGMRILYGASTGGASAGDVLMATRLRSGLDLSEVQLATELVNAYKRRNPGLVFTALRPLPLEKDGTEVSIGSALGQYSVAKEKIAITALSDVLGEIEVSWVTDPVTKENLQLALVEDVGVSGEVAFAVAGGSLVSQVPISIRLADRESFGRVRWDRTQGTRNQTPYPLRLRYLHALCIDPRTNLPILYTWSLGDTEVPPLARVQWDAARVPAWIDTEAKRIWVDYGVSQNCDACDKRVLEGITGGVSSVAAEQITFRTITPLADAGGYEITAQVRSKFFDPRDRAVVQKTVVLAADNKDFMLGPIYRAERQDGEPLFEYRLDLAMPDGKTHRGSQWIRSDELRVIVGKAQLEQSLGTLPGRTPEPRP